MTPAPRPERALSDECRRDRDRYAENWDVNARVGDKRERK